MPGQDERNVEWIPVGGEGFLSSKDPYTNMAKDKKVIPDPIDDRKFQE